MSRAPRSAVAAAVAGATSAALLVGLGEAVVVMIERHLVLDAGLLFFALLFYGLAGVAIGVATGVVLALLGRVARWTLSVGGAYALSGAATLSVLATVIGRFRVFRDVFNETFDGQPISARTFQLASLAAAALLFAVTCLLMRIAARRHGVVTSPAVVVGGLVLALVITGGAMRLGTPVASAPPQRAIARAPAAPSVILLMVDTLRADHLSCYGYTAHRTPAIDALAADGARFARAYAQASWTRPSVATILTSLYPSSHNAVHKSDILPEQVITLPEVMRGAGYRTVGFADNINIAPLFGFQQGFDEYAFLEPAFFFGATEAAAQLTIYSQLRLLRERYFSGTKYVENYYQPAEVVTARALEWLARSGEQRPFFMFLHYMDPHDPYFTHPYNGEGLARVANPKPDPSQADRYRAAYDGEIRYLDAEIGHLLDGLKARGLYDRNVIVLTSDHGEEFYEHGGWWHGLTLYDEQIAVPLIVKPPRGGDAGVVSQALVSSLDIAPTILALTGLAAPAAMQGQPLRLDVEAPAPRDYTFAEQDLEGNILQAYHSGRWKLIQANLGNPRGLPPRQLFEMARDPREQHDLAAVERDQVAALAAHLTAVRSHAEAMAVRGRETVIDSATEERLRALGYVH
jgi:arylsulfatase A-like enzyme